MTTRLGQLGLAVDRLSGTPLGSGVAERLAQLLLGDPEGLAAGTIVSQGVSLEAVREAVTATLPPAAENVPDLIPFSPRAKKVLELTFREALRLGHNYVGTEHILLALLEFEDGAGALTDLGITKPVAEAHITTTLAHIVAARKEN